jgi:uncharacterized surface protein with fasciclin (FAS1) repeats
MFKSNNFNKPNKNLSCKYTKGSIMELLNSHPDFTKFTYIIKLAEMDKILDDTQANFTIFVPSDNELKYNSSDDKLSTMDRGDARQIVLSSLIDDRIPKELLTDSPASYMITKNPVNRIFITNIDDVTKINNNLTIILFDIIRTNGIIHVVNKLIEPLKM